MRIDDVLEKVLDDIDRHQENDKIATGLFRRIFEQEIEKKYDARGDKQDENVGKREKLQNHRAFSEGKNLCLL